MAREGAAVSPVTMVATTTTTTAITTMTTTTTAITTMTTIIIMTTIMITTTTMITTREANRRGDGLPKRGRLLAAVARSQSASAFSASALVFAIS